MASAAGVGPQHGPDFLNGNCWTRVCGMSHAERVLRAAAIRLAGIQLAIVLVTSVVYAFKADQFAAYSSLAGGLLALLNTGISTYFLHRATAISSIDERQGLLLFYVGAALRFVAVPLVFGVGIVLLEFNPVAMLAGFGLAQLGYLFNKVKV